MEHHRLLALGQEFVDDVIRLHGEVPEAQKRNGKPVVKQGVRVLVVLHLQYKFCTRKCEFRTKTYRHCCGNRPQHKGFRVVFYAQQRRILTCSFKQPLDDKRTALELRIGGRSMSECTRMPDMQFGM